MKLRLCISLPLMLFAILTALAQPPGPGGGAGAANGEVPLVERLIWVRREYQKALEQLRFYYTQTSDTEKTKWAEEELRDCT